MDTFKQLVTFGVGRWQMVVAFLCGSACLAIIYGFNKTAIAGTVLAAIYNLYLVWKRDSVTRYLDRHPEIIQELARDVIKHDVKEIKYG